MSMWLIDYLEKGKTINSKYNMALMMRLKEAKKVPQTKIQKCSFTKTRQRVISRWQSCMNCAWNGCRLNRILQNWRSATITCSQTSKERSPETDMTPMKKWSPKLYLFLHGWTNRSKRKAKNTLAPLEWLLHSRRKLCLRIKSNLSKQLHYIPKLTTLIDSNYIKRYW